MRNDTYLAWCRLCLFAFALCGCNETDDGDPWWPGLGSGLDAASGAASPADAGDAFTPFPGVDAGGTPVFDAGSATAGDASSVGASSADASTIDATIVDASARDAATTADAAPADAAAADGSVSIDASGDSGREAGSSEAGAPPDSSLHSDGAVATDGAVGADGSSGQPRRCTGKPGAKRDRSEQSVTAAGVQRSFVYYAPPGLDPNEPVPLVIVPHGSTMSGQQMYEITRYADLARREKFVVAFPDGEDGPGGLAPWNVGNATCGAGGLIWIVENSGDDQAFVNEIIKFAGADQCIDQEHIFMTGFSMGGYFSHETGCLNPAIRAIGPHSGGTHDLSQCPNQHKPTIIFHFKSDALIEYECAVSARDEWMKHNGCSPQSPDVVQVKGGSCEYYKGCPADGQLAFCSFDEGGQEASPVGHGWSGGSKDGGNPVAAIPSTESATELGWTFFKRYAW